MTTDLQQYIIKDSIHKYTMIKMVREYNYNKDKYTRLLTIHKNKMRSKYNLNIGEY